MNWIGCEISLLCRMCGRLSPQVYPLNPNQFSMEDPKEDRDPNQQVASGSPRKSSLASNCPDYSTLPLEILILILSCLSPKDLGRCSLVNRSFKHAIDLIWSRIQEIPSCVSPVDVRSFLRKTPSIEYFDCTRFSSVLTFFLASDLAKFCPRIRFFNRVHEGDLSFVDFYLFKLKAKSCLEKVSIVFEDWGEDLGDPLVDYTFCLIDSIFDHDKSPFLTELKLTNQSYNQMTLSELWPRIGAKLTHLSVDSSGIMNTITTIAPSIYLQSVEACFSQADFDWISYSCPNLKVLKDVTYYNEELPPSKAILAVEGDGFAANGSLLDLSPLMRLTKIEEMTLTCLVSKESRYILNDWIVMFGSQLTLLSLNLSNGDIGVLQTIMEVCLHDPGSKLTSLNLVLSMNDIIKRYGCWTNFSDRMKQVMYPGVEILVSTFPRIRSKTT